MKQALAQWNGETLPVDPLNDIVLSDDDWLELAGFAPSTLERIESEAFLNCFNLKSAQYGKDVKIDPTSFKGCANLTY